MAYQPIKFSKKQYSMLKGTIQREWGNISLAKGLYLITYLYLKYVPKHIKEKYKKKYYNSFNNRRATLHGK